MFYNLSFLFLFLREPKLQPLETAPGLLFPDLVQTVILLSLFNLLLVAVLLVTLRDNQVFGTHIIPIAYGGQFFNLGLFFTSSSKYIASNKVNITKAPVLLRDSKAEVTLWGSWV